MESKNALEIWRNKNDKEIDAAYKINRSTNRISSSVSMVAFTYERKISVISNRELDKLCHDVMRSLSAVEAEPFGVATPAPVNANAIYVMNVTKTPGLLCSEGREAGLVAAGRDFAQKFIRADWATYREKCHWEEQDRFTIPSPVGPLLTHVQLQRTADGVPYFCFEISLYKGRVECSPIDNIVPLQQDIDSRTGVFTVRGGGETSLTVNCEEGGRVTLDKSSTPWRRIPSVYVVSQQTLSFPLVEENEGKALRDGCRGIDYLSLDIADPL